MPSGPSLAGAGLPEPAEEPEPPEPPEEVFEEEEPELFEFDFWFWRPDCD